MELLPKIKEIFPDSRVEHVGSSSIPGAISKGDLDIFLGVGKEEFSEAIQQLGSLGFYEKEDTLRTESLRMMITNLYSEDVAIQVVENGSEYDFFVEFRDKLRSNPELVSQYNKLKLGCIGMEYNRYRDIKSAFVESVLNTP
ncbi:GrpB family protein [Dasania marina]|uniref:GrpB family protein n=1 Tax=Dasania marina TaxID=471499 RepID=UPI001969C692|nr:GrpB family protein [Dasania marina]